MVFLLTFLTGGIYGWYWFVKKTKDEINKLGENVFLNMNLIYFLDQLAAIKVVMGTAKIRPILPTRVRIISSAKNS